MKLFISWSGDRSRIAAVALREWLPLILHYVEPWLSDRDVAAGERWAVEIGRELEGTQFGIIVLTTDNLSAPWILFEAGALSKAFTASRVCPYLVDLDFKDVSGPLSQFQAKKSDRASTLELLESINSNAANSVPAPRLAELFDALWPRLEVRLKGIPVATGEGPKARSQAQVLEELVVATRRMESRLDDIATRSPQAMPRSRHAVSIVLKTPAPNENLKGFSVFKFWVDRNLIDDVARLTGYEVNQYGRQWYLRTAATGRIVAQDEGRRFAMRARVVEQEFVLEVNVPAGSIEPPENSSGNADMPDGE